MREEKSIRDAQKIITELKEENERLRRSNAVLKFNLLPEAEQIWALNVFNMDREKPELFWHEVDKFKQEYINYKERNNDDLPF